MADAIKNRWPLLLVLIAFIALKIPALHYPFFWDESWSYAPAVKLMYQHGPSLMPDAIDALYSRGHPLFFYASAAAWMRLFGDGHVAQHSFSLLISVLLLIAVYEVCLRLFNARMAFMALLATVTQVMFFVQSTLLLPEVMVALFALATVYFYVSGKHLLTFLSCTALVLTKESGATLGLVLGGHALYNLFNKEQTIKTRIQLLVPVAGAGIVLGIFFAIQYMKLHWVLYPEHTGYIDTSWEMMAGKFRFSLEILFTHQSRIYLLGLCCIMAIVSAVIKKDWRYLGIVAAAAVFAIIEQSLMGYISRKALIPFSFALLVYMFHLLLAANKHRGKQAMFILLSASFFIVYVSFCCINFFTDRYLMTALVFLVILTCYALDSYMATMPKPAYYACVAAIVIIGYVAFTTGPRTGDVNLGIYDAMDVQQDIVNYMEQNKLYDQPIAASSSLQRVHLMQPNTGFLSGNKTFGHITYDVNDSSQFVIIDNIEKSDTAKAQQAPATFNKIYRTQHGESWAEIYRRK